MKGVCLWGETIPEGLRGCIVRFVCSLFVCLCLDTKWSHGWAKPDPGTSGQHDLDPANKTDGKHTQPKILFFSLRRKENRIRRKHVPSHRHKATEKGDCVGRLVRVRHAKYKAQSQKVHIVRYKINIIIMEADEPQAHGQYSKILLTGDGGRDGRGSDKLGVKKKDDIEVSLVTSPSVDSNDDNEDGEYNEGNDGDDDGAFGSNNDRDDDDAYDGNQTYFRDICHNVMIRTLTPDVTKLTIGSYPLVEGMFTIKLMKFILLTFASITVVHVLVPYVTDDRDHALELWQIQGKCTQYFYISNVSRFEHILFLI